MRGLVTLFIIGWVAVFRAQLPIVYLDFEGTPSSETDIAGKFRLKDGTDSVTCAVSLHIHGQTATIYEKKSFKLKLKDTKGEDLDIPLLGMRNDNSWLLDAMAVDLARCRNRVSWDIWNEFSTPSYIAAFDKKTRNGIEGRFVEVFLNGKYWGLYCLNECMDRKQLRLRKYNAAGQCGLLVKDVYNADFKENLNVSKRFYTDNSKETWLLWEAKYPKRQEGEPLDWTPFVSFVHFLNMLDEETVKKHLAERIDLPVVTDILVMNDLTHGDDNIKKNLYFYFYDINLSQMMGMTLWDMDSTWGRDFRAKTKGASTEFDADKQNLIFDYAAAITDVGKRYAELRQSFLQPERLKAHFAKYFQLFRESGAAERETTRWSGTNRLTLDFEQEEAYIMQWIDDRIRYLDEKYGVR